MERAGVYGRQSSNKAKSIAEQLEAGHEAVTDQGWTHVGDYQDGSSASRYATKERDEWSRLLADVVAEKLDVLILWESSRGDRTAKTWLQFLDDCREHQVRIYVITHDRTYDLSRARDWKTLAEDGIASAFESELLSVRTRRGHAGAAKAGLPPGGPTPYGYRRTFDPNTGKRIGQEIFEAEAAIVREIYDRIGRGHAILAIATDLNARQIPCAVADQWEPAAVRRIAKSPVYVALRRHRGNQYKAVWEPIVGEQTYHGVQRVLSEPGRKITRPGRQLHLLSYLARCGVCGAFLDYARSYYRCTAKGCVAVPKVDADGLVEEIVIARLQQPDALKILTSADGEEAGRFELEAEELRLQLKNWRISAAKGKTSPESLTVIEEELTSQIKTLESKAVKSVLPPLLRKMLRPEADVQRLWDDATIVARRTVIKALCEIKFGKGTPGRVSEVKRRQRTLVRLAASRWIGDQETWGQRWT